VEIDASARKHDVDDEDMLHAYRNHWVSFETPRSNVTMYVGPSYDGRPLEIGVVTDEDGQAIIHAMPARMKFLRKVGRLNETHPR
jgi:hypothetical protein